MREKRKGNVMDVTLAGKVALVTGASKGVGRGIALELARAGADVAVNCHTDTAGAAVTVSAIQALGRRAVVTPADVGKRADVERMVDQTVAALGRLDVLIANAGVTLWVDFLALDDATWEQTIGTNLRGTYLTCQAATRQFQKQGKGGRLITMGSGAARVAFPGASAYNASKGGIAMLTQGMAVELGPLGITVNCVAPGAIEIERTRREDPHYAETWGRLAPLRRVGTPADIGNACVWLASDAASFVTGQVIFVDGGLFAQGPWPGDQYGRDAAGNDRC
jgi:NAD(P)-dependent dehydrogenase (short-subunit alcohol dehydrogenase family)